MGDRACPRPPIIGRKLVVLLALIPILPTCRGPDELAEARAQLSRIEREYFLESEALKAGMVEWQAALRVAFDKVLEGRSLLEPDVGDEVSRLEHRLWDRDDRIKELVRSHAEQVRRVADLERAASKSPPSAG